MPSTPCLDMHLRTLLILGQTISWNLPKKKAESVNIHTAITFPIPLRLRKTNLMPNTGFQFLPKSHCREGETTGPPKEAIAAIMNKFRLTTRHGAVTAIGSAYLPPPTKPKMFPIHLHRGYPEQATTKSRIPPSITPSLFAPSGIPLILLFKRNRLSLFCFSVLIKMGFWQKPKHRLHRVLFNHYPSTNGQAALKTLVRYHRHTATGFVHHWCF